MTDGPDVEERPPDRRPEVWSSGADGYHGSFAGFTGLYVDEMLDRLGVDAGSAVLDVATGTGSAAVRAASRGATVTAVDFAPGMVEVARRRLEEVGPGSTAEVMDGEHLDLPDSSFDAGLSMFGLMFFPDRAAGLRELARVVSPGGRVGTATWDIDGFLMHGLVGEALARVLPDVRRDPPPPVWAPVGTPDGLRSLFDGAPVEDVEVHAVERRWHFEEPARFFTDMPGWAPPMQAAFRSMPPEVAAAAAEAFGEVGPTAPGCRWWRCSGPPR